MAFTPLYLSLMCLFVKSQKNYRVRTKPSAEQVLSLDFRALVIPQVSATPIYPAPSGAVGSGMSTGAERGLWFLLHPSGDDRAQPLPPQVASLVSPGQEISTQRVPGARSARDNPSTHFPLPGKCFSPTLPHKPTREPHTSRDVFNGALWRLKPLSYKQAAKSKFLMMHPDRRNTARPPGSTGNASRTLGMPMGHVRPWAIQHFLLLSIRFLLPPPAQQAVNATAVEWQPGRGWDTNLECHSPCSIPVTVTCPQQQQVPPAGDAAGAGTVGLWGACSVLGEREQSLLGQRQRPRPPLGSRHSYGYLLYVLLFSFPGPKIRDFL